VSFPGVFGFAEISLIALALADKDDYFAGPDQSMMIRSLEWPMGRAEKSTDIDPR
jgi:hypothetical protein